MDVLISSQKLLERLGREEQQLKRLGHFGPIEGLRLAITILIRESQTPESPPPLEPSN
jgi:hypothetical protein